MQAGNSVIIHSSPIIRQGLKGILLSRNIGIHEILNDVPDAASADGWKEMLILADARYAGEIKSLRRGLTRNGNMLIGIDHEGSETVAETAFDEILNIYDPITTLIRLITGYHERIAGIKPDNQLSSRETEVLSMVAGGLSNKEIAGRLFISIHTVITHRKNITFKLGIKSIPGLTLYASLNDLVDFQR